MFVEYAKSISSLLIAIVPTIGVPKDLTRAQQISAKISRKHPDKKNTSP